MDLSQISAILSLEPDATSPYAIGRLGLSMREMIELADSCALSSFCNLARDPSTPVSQLLAFCLTIRGCLNTASTVRPDLDCVVVLLELKDPIEVSEALKSIKNPNNHFHKPFSLPWAVLKQSKTAGIEFSTLAQLAVTTKEKALALEDQAEQAQAASNGGARPTTSRLLTFRSALNNIKKNVEDGVGGTPLSNHDYAAVFNTVERFLQEECNIEALNNDSIWLNFVNTILKEVHEIMNHAVDIKVGTLEAHFDAFCKRLKKVVIKSAVSSGIKCYASEAACADWDSKFNARSAFLILLPKVLPLGITSDGKTLALKHVINEEDFGAHFLEFQSAMDVCAAHIDDIGDKPASVACFLSPGVAKQFHELLNDRIIAGTCVFAQTGISTFIANHRDALHHVWPHTIPGDNAEQFPLLVESAVPDMRLMQLNYADSIANDAKKLLAMITALPKEVEAKLECTTGTCAVSPIMVALAPHFINVLRELAALQTCRLDVASSTADYFATISSSRLTVLASSLTNGGWWRVAQAILYSRGGGMLCKQFTNPHAPQPSTWLYKFSYNFVKSFAMDTVLVNEGASSTPGTFEKCVLIHVMQEQLRFA